MGYQVKEVYPTPNPNAVKYILDRQITETPTSFFEAESAKDHLLASRLFGVVGVSSVFMLNDFVTINKSSEARWADITPKVKKVLSRFESV